MLIQLIVIQIVTFLVIVFVLRKLFYTESVKESARLKQLNEAFIEKQKQLNEKIDAAEEIYQQKLSKAEAEVLNLRSRAEEEIAGIKKDALEKARQEAERIVTAALNTKDKLRDEIISQIQGQAPEAAARIFRDVLPPRAKEVVHRELVARAGEEIKQIPAAKFKGKIEKAQLLYALPLQKAEADIFVSVISEKLGHSVALEEKQEDSLLAGIVIVLGDLIIDASLENRLKQIRDSLNTGE